MVHKPFIPDAQTLLTVVQTTVLGIPAPSAACLAGAWPRFALSTFPKNTSSTSDGSIFALLRAPKVELKKKEFNMKICMVKKLYEHGGLSYFQ